MGFTIVSMDYRLAPETNLDGMLDDLKLMEGWLRKHLPNRIPDGRARIDTNKVIVVGASAGSLLALSTVQVSLSKSHQ